MAANDAVTQAARMPDAMAPAAPALATPESVAPDNRASRRPLAKSGGAAPSSADSQAQLAPADRAFASMRLALSAEAQRWTWRRDGGPAHSIGDPLTGWLAELDAAAASRWSPAPARPSAEASSAGLQRLQLLRDGRVVHTLQLGAEEVRWEAADADGGSGVESRAAPLDPKRAQSLRQGLSRLAP
jgi:hypothetical protein